MLKPARGKDEGIWLLGKAGVLGSMAILCSPLIVRLPTPTPESGMACNPQIARSPDPTLNKNSGVHECLLHRLKTKLIEQKSKFGFVS
jgi:hypothetical protein